MSIKITADFLDSCAAAELLAVSASYLAKLRMSQDGPHFFKFGRSVRYRRADLDEWADSRRRQSTFDETTRGS